jgi:hypothetical protein
LSPAADLCRFQNRLFWWGRELFVRHH